MEVCRLCLDLQSDNTYLPLDGTYKDMVQVVAPELNLQVSNAPIVCNECSSNLDELFAFKTKCFENEQQIRPKCENTKNKFRLKEILDGTTNLDELSLKTENAKDRVCRTCLAPIECESFTILRPSESDAYLDSMLAMCLPEIDLELTKDPVMCESCLENLQTLHHFKSTCLDIEDKLTSFCETHGTNSSDQINLNTVLESETLKMGQNSEYANIKSEFNDESEDVSMRSENDSEMTGDTGQLKQEEVDIKSETDPSAVGSDKEDEEPKEKCHFLKNNCEHKNAVYKKSMYKCSECSYQSSWKISLKRHLLKQHGKGDKSKLKNCGLCTFVGQNAGGLKKHQKAVHDRVKDYECFHCSYKTSYKRALVQHLLAKHNKGDETLWKNCTECTFKTFNGDVLTRHMKMVHEGVTFYKCPICYYTADTQELVSQHSLNYHKPDDESKLKDGLFQCSECPYRSNIKINFERHLLRRHGTGDKSKLKKCFQCAYKALTDSHLKRHENAVHNQIKTGSRDVQFFECCECPYKATQKTNLIRHSLTYHRKDQLKKCTKCPYQVFNIFDLRRHEKAVHDKVKDVQCSECSYKTTTKVNLQKHLLRKHAKGDDSRIKRCTQCTFKSTSFSKLQEHVKAIHKGLKEFACSHCNYETGFKSNLRTHLMMAHGQNKNKDKST